MAELVGDDVLSGEVTGGTELLLELHQEVEVEVHEVVERAVERPGLRRRLTTTGVGESREEHGLGVLVVDTERERQLLDPDRPCCVRWKFSLWRPRVHP